MRTVALGMLLLAASLQAAQPSAPDGPQAIALGERNIDALAHPDWAVNADGSVVVVATRQPLLADDRNGLRDIYVLDRRSGRVTLETAGVGGQPSDGESSSPDVSADGRVIVFASTARNLLSSSNTGDASCVYARDRQSGVSSLIATHASSPAISADGDSVVYETTGACGSSAAPAVVTPRICLARREDGTRLLVSARPSGGESGGQSVGPAIDGAGDHVVFTSTEPLVPEQTTRSAETSGVPQIFLVEVRTGLISLVSVATDGGRGNAPSYHAAISADGRYVAFASAATNLTPPHRPARAQVYLRDMHTRTTTLVSQTAGGRPGNGASLRPVLSRDGSRVAFQTLASDLVRCATCRPLAPDVNLLWDVLVYDVASSSILPVAGEFDTVTGSHGVVMDKAGTTVVYASRQPRDAADVGEDADVFIVPWPSAPSSAAH